MTVGAAAAVLEMNSTRATSGHSPLEVSEGWIRCASEYFPCVLPCLLVGIDDANHACDTVGGSREAAVRPIGPAPTRRSVCLVLCVSVDPIAVFPSR